MPTSVTIKTATKRNNLFLRVSKGHFATSNSHSNYYIDVAAQKSRLSEAKAVAEELCSYYRHSTIIDTILCLDGTEVIGTCLADQLTAADFINLNAHQTIYVVTPESINSSQLLFRDNIVPMIANKNVLILAVSVATGRTVEAAIDAVKYYGGKVAGVSAIFASVKQCGDYEVNSVFNPKDIPDYFSLKSDECPLCKAGQKLDALINCHGFSKL